jgi:transcriptional regulator with XRE-family HTH domain
MQSLSDYVTELRHRQNLPSDYALAAYLGLSKQAVSNWKNRGVIADPATAWRIAEGIDADPAQVIAAAELARAERSHDDRLAKLWTERLRQMGAALVLVFAGFFHAGDAVAAPDPAANAPDSVYYVKSYSWLMVRLRWLFRSLCLRATVRQCRPCFNAVFA